VGRGKRGAGDITAEFVDVVNKRTIVAKAELLRLIVTRQQAVLVLVELLQRGDVLLGVEEPQQLLVSLERINYPFFVLCFDVRLNVFI